MRECIFFVEENSEILYYISDFTGGGGLPCVLSILMLITSFYCIYHIETEFYKVGLMTVHRHGNFNHSGHSTGPVPHSIWQRNRPTYATQPSRNVAD